MRRWGFPLLVVSVLVACNGGISQSSASDEGGLESGTGCSALSACCATVSGASASLCNEVLGSNDSAYCATELIQLQAEGDCLGLAEGGTSGSSSGFRCERQLVGLGIPPAPDLARDPAPERPARAGPRRAAPGVYEASNSSASSGVNPYDGSGGGPVDSGVMSDTSPPATCTGVTCGSSQACSVLPGVAAARTASLNARATATALPSPSARTGAVRRSARHALPATSARAAQREAVGAAHRMQRLPARQLLRPFLSEHVHVVPGLCRVLAGRLRHVHHQQPVQRGPGLRQPGLHDLHG